MRLTVFSFLIAFVMSGCFFNTNKGIKGNGDIKTKDYSVSQFNDVEVSNAIDVIVKQDSAYAVKLVTDANLMEYINIDADYRHHLTIGVTKGYDLRPTDKIKVYLSSPRLNILNASGASSIVGKGTFNFDEQMYCTASGASTILLTVNTTSASLKLSGASTINLNGTAKNLKIDATGASKVNCFELITDSVSANISGATKCQLNVSKHLSAIAAGASTIVYKGNATVEKNESGASSISKEE